MFRKLRIAILLYVLILVGAVQLLTAAEVTDWEEPLWVDIWFEDAAGTATASKFLESLNRDDFAAIERFFADQGHRFGIGLEQPFRIDVAGELDRPLPLLPEPGDRLATVLWSLKMRWFTSRLHWRSDRPTPDITVFARFHGTQSGVALDRSTALRKGLIAVANVFADPRMQATNRIVIAHELLHTLGATDKYDLQTNQPLVPVGLAAPARQPLYPQPGAELMAGRIALSPADSVMPARFAEVLIGPATAREIGWAESTEDGGAGADHTGTVGL